MINANRDQLRHSAQTKKEAACELLKGKRLHPTPAVYLSHVALECALKRRILLNNRVTHVDELKRLLTEEAFNGLFRGTSGHDLNHLANTVSLDRYLVATGNKPLRGQREWQAMAGDRPYSLRYGSETVSADDAKRQVQFAVKLTGLILGGAQ